VSIFDFKDSEARSLTATVVQVADVDRSAIWQSANGSAK
jgi:hypothetical protein